MLYNCVLARFSGEFGIKSSYTQDHMERILRSNIINSLKSLGKKDLLSRLQIISRFGRFYLVPKNPVDSDIEDLILVAGRTFGLSTVSPCFMASVRDKTSLRTIPAKLVLSFGLYPTKAGIKVDEPAVSVDEKSWQADIDSLCNKFMNDESRVSRNRFHANKHWFMGSWAYFSEKKLEIEVFKQYAYVTVERIKAPGGFPFGLDDSLVALVSGGIDSPVAAWMAMRRGSPVIFVVMNTSDSQKDKALKEVKVLSEYMSGFEPRVLLIPYVSALKELSRVGNATGVTCLLCKRFMYRVAEGIALSFKAKGIITGEILGEQASQTAQNLMILNKAADMPIFRPLFGFDKDEVVSLSRQIGTAPVANIAQDSCFGVPSRPETRGSIKVVMDAEGKLDVNGLVSGCLKGMVSVSLGQTKNL